MTVDPRTQRLLITLFAVKFFQNAALAVIPPVLVRVSDTLGLSAIQAGGVIAAFGVSRLLLIVPVGVILNRASRARLMLTGGSGFVLAGTIWFGLATQYSALLAGRALVGIGNGMTHLAGLVVMLAWCPRAYVARVFNLWEAVGIASYAVHAFIGGLIGERWGWRMALLWAAAFAAAAGITLLCGIRGVHTPPAWAAYGRRAEPTINPSRPMSSHYILILLTSFTLSVCWTGVMTTLIPLYGGTVLGFGPRDIGLVLSVAFLLDMLLLFPAGYMMDQRQRTMPIFLALGALLVAGLLLPHTRSFGSFLTVTVVFAAGFSVWSLPSALVADLCLGRHQGLALGLVRGSGDVANVLAPLALGFLVQQWGYDEAMWAVGVLLVVNLLIAVPAGLAHGVPPRTDSSHERREA